MYLSSEFYYPFNNTYRYVIMKFPVNTVPQFTTWYLKSANGTAENQPVLMFGETEDTLYSFGR